MINLEYTQHRVIYCRSINADLFELAVERCGIEFTPGDCVAVYSEFGQSRPYSIASGSSETTLRFLIREMDGGEVSPWLKARRPGDCIRITPPFGWFRPGQDIGSDPFIFLATGTGIAPFLSYIKTFARPPAACLYGIRHKDDAFGYAELLRCCPNTQLAVSREQSEHHFGRITDLVDALPAAAQTHYYCCGLESMIHDATALLQERGVPLSHIHREVFFHG